jgi:hypothetical protein
MSRYGTRTRDLRRDRPERPFVAILAESLGTARISCIGAGSPPVASHGCVVRRSGSNPAKRHLLARRAGFRSPGRQRRER